jgi:TetR/AcrR family transcriptional repressor of mexJK operon
MPSPKKAARKTRSNVGRPTREQALLRHEELLDEALEQFLEKGFVMTTVDAIAVSVGMTKRTVYSRYPDKKALFAATVQRAIERWIVPVETLSALDCDDLEGTLTAVARIRMQNANSPDGLRLQRILNAESYRFPEIFALAYDQGTVPTIKFLADLLRRHTRAGTIRVRQPEIAALAFLSMVIGAPSRAMVWGDSVDEKLLRERVRICVELFLNGVRRR